MLDTHNIIIARCLVVHALAMQAGVPYLVSVKSRTVTHQITTGGPCGQGTADRIDTNSEVAVTDSVT